jgi:hypothetical protein
MTRKTFLTIASTIATTVGIFALLFPVILQESKGTQPNAATYVWTSEVGLVLIAIGVMAFLIRGEENSPALRAFFIGNLIIQIGLFAIEFIAYGNGVISKLEGVLPNLALHVLLAFGFAYYLKEMRQSRVSK